MSFIAITSRNEKKTRCVQTFYRRNQIKKLVFDLKNDKFERLRIFVRFKTW